MPPKASDKKVFRAIRELCTGCHICEMVCSMRQASVFSPYQAAIRVNYREEDGTYNPTICRHCKVPFCMEACPVPNAMSYHADLAGVVVVNHDKCIGCFACVDACPFGALQVGADQQVFKCDLCNGDPLCVKYCPERPEDVSPALPYPRARALEYVEPKKFTRKLRSQTADPA